MQIFKLLAAASILIFHAAAVALPEDDPGVKCSFNNPKFNSPTRRLDFRLHTMILLLRDTKIDFKNLLNDLIAAGAAPLTITVTATITNRNICGNYHSALTWPDLVAPHSDILPRMPPTRFTPVAKCQKLHLKESNSVSAQPTSSDYPALGLAAVAAATAAVVSVARLVGGRRLALDFVVIGHGDLWSREDVYVQGIRVRITN
ncbi:hypothetical protein FB451DRAFT_1195484 [Mycena latifolia]|nr:hypothetical protein FB451DRAFT_1195484 [Mycena latifolia]